MIELLFKLLTNKFFWIILFVLVIAGTIFYYVTENKNLKKELDIVTQNYLAANDSLRVTKKLNGEIVQKYAFLRDIEDSLKSKLGFEHQKLLAEQSTVVELRLKLASTSNVVAIKDSLLSALLTPSYKDSGLSVEARDSVVFKRLNDRWKAYSFSSYKIFIKLLNRITRTKEGKLEGSVETFSPYLSISDLRTVIDDQFVNNSLNKLENQSKRKFGILGEVDYNSLAGGVILNINDWGFQLKYILFSARNVFPNMWYDRLRISVNKYIW